MMSAFLQASATDITSCPSFIALFQLEPPSFSPTITLRPESLRLFACASPWIPYPIIAITWSLIGSKLISESFQVFAIKKIQDSTHIIYIVISLLHLTHLTLTPSESRRSNFLDPQFVQIGQARADFINHVLIDRI